MNWRKLRDEMASAAQRATPQSRGHTSRAAPACSASLGGTDQTL